MNNRAVESIYNKLFQAEHRIKAKGRLDSYPVHKKLRFDDPSISDLYQWLEHHVQISANASILDAGCGVGHTLINLCVKGKRQGLGISLSHHEINYARKVCAQLGMQDRCRFETRSFDDMLNGSFDLVVAIESLKHSESITDSIKNLINHLNKNGQIIVIEDFIIDSGETFYEHTLQQSWALKTLYTEAHIHSYVKSNHKLSYESIDLTRYIPIHKRNFLQFKIIITRFLAVIFKPFRQTNVLQIYLGGLCLEWLYRTKKVAYKAIIISKIA